MEFMEIMILKNGLTKNMNLKLKSQVLCAAIIQNDIAATVKKSAISITAPTVVP